MTTERKAPPLIDDQVNIVSEAFFWIRKSLNSAQQACSDAECDEASVLKSIADLVATYCGQQIK